MSQSPCDLTSISEAYGKKSDVRSVYGGVPARSMNLMVSFGGRFVQSQLLESASCNRSGKIYAQQAIALDFLAGRVEQLTRNECSKDGPHILLRSSAIPRGPS